MKLPIYRPNISKKLHALNARSKTRKIPMVSWLFDNPGKAVMLSTISAGVGFAICFFLRL